MFGEYKQSITDTLVTTYPNKKVFKKSFHKLMQALKENKISREFFVLYGEIENKIFDDKNIAEEYLDAVIKILKNKKKNLKIPLIKEHTGLGENKIYSQLDNLIFNESVKSIEKNIRNKRNLVKHLTREDNSISINKVVPTSLLSNLATKKFNKKYSSLNEEDRTKLKNLLSLDKNEIKETIEKLKENTLKQLDTLKVAADKKEMKSKIEKVTESVLSSNNDILSIVKIEKLNKSLIK